MNLHYSQENSFYSDRGLSLIVSIQRPIFNMPHIFNPLHSLFQAFLSNPKPTSDEISILSDSLAMEKEVRDINLCYTTNKKANSQE